MNECGHGHHADLVQRNNSQKRHWGGKRSILTLHGGSRSHRRHLTALSHCYECLLSLHSWAEKLLWDLAHLLSGCSVGRRAWCSGQTWKILSRADERSWGEQHRAGQVRVSEQGPGADSKCFMTALQMWLFFSCKTLKKKRMRSSTRWCSGLKFYINYVVHNTCLLISLIYKQRATAHAEQPRKSCAVSAGLSLLLAFLLSAFQRFPSEARLLGQLLRSLKQRRADSRAAEFNFQHTILWPIQVFGSKTNTWEHGSKHPDQSPQ